MAPKSFNNVIIGQFVLTGVPIKVYTSGRFLTVTDADDVEDPLMGFGMDENGDMIQFAYPAVEFLSVQGNKVDIETYNKGMEKLHSGDEAPADAEPAKDDPADKEGGEEDKGDNPMKDHYIPNLSTLIEITKDEQDAEQKAIDSEEKAAQEKFKAAQAAFKGKLKSLKDREKANKAQTVEEGDAAIPGTYTFGKGDIIQNTNPGCVHYGSKGIVIGIPKTGIVRYTVTNGDMTKTYRPGDILTKTADQLEPLFEPSGLE